MRANRLAVVCWLLGALSACEDDKGGSGSSPDAPVDMRGDGTSDTAPGGSDALVDVQDAGPSDVQDVRPSVDCAQIACNSSVVFKVPGFVARFGEDARLIDVTACRGARCADARVQLVGTNGSTVTPGDGGPAQVGASYSDDLLEVSFLPATTPSATPRQEEMRLRIATSGGRELVEFRTQAPVEVFCPGGLACGICEATFVQLDNADGGQPVDANMHPGRGGLCQ